MFYNLKTMWMTKTTFFNTRRYPSRLEIFEGKKIVLVASVLSLSSVTTMNANIGIVHGLLWIHVQSELRNDILDF